MGKYGPGVSMKTVQRLEMEETYYSPENEENK